MGTPKNGGYQKLDTLAPNQSAGVDQLLQQALPYLQQSAQGYSQFLPGGGGGQAFINQAQKNFQQQTIPSIMNAFGSNSKTSSALNQALASGAANLNTDLAAQLAGMQLQAAQGIGNLGQFGAGAGLTPKFAYQQKQMPYWQQLLLAATQGAAGAATGAATGGF